MIGSYSGAHPTASITLHSLVELFLPLEGDAFDDLVADIKVHSLREPRGVRLAATDGAAS
jgi:hypothetical protein